MSSCVGVQRRRQALYRVYIRASGYLYQPAGLISNYLKNVFLQNRVYEGFETVSTAV